MLASIQCAKFVAQREALVTLAYPDGFFADGKQKFSYGFGSQSRRPKAGDTITVEEAFALLREDIDTRAVVVSRAIGKEVTITQAQFDMLVSLYYQSGSKALSTVAALYRAGQPYDAIIAFAGFTGDGNDGLIKRRIREMHISLTGDYGDLTQFPFYDGDPRKVARQMATFPEVL